MSRFTILLGAFWIALAIILFVSQYLIPVEIELTWETESEFDTVGFNVLRSDSETGQFTRINKGIIPGSNDPVAGGSYRYIDKDVEPGKSYYYRLEDIEYNNNSGLHETIEASVQGRPWWIGALAMICGLAGIAVIFETVLGQRGNRQ